LDVEKRLLEDATSFTSEVTSLDTEGFISRTLAALGTPAENSEADKATPEAGRTSGRPPAGDADPGTLVKSNHTK
jgi:hypothetical protein